MNDDVIQYDMSEPMPVRIAVGDRIVAPVLSPDSFSTLILGAPPAAS